MFCPSHRPLDAHVLKQVRHCEPDQAEPQGGVVQLSKEDMGVFNGLAASGKQKRVNTRAWGHDLVCSPTGSYCKRDMQLTWETV